MTSFHTRRSCDASLVKKMEEEEGEDDTRVVAVELTREFSYLHMGFREIASVVWQRAAVLIVLLLLQSTSQLILGMYEEIISQHVIIPMFLTMLIGAGGNAGNQSTVRSITGLATREFRLKDYFLVLRKEIVCGLVTSSLLTVVGFVRVHYFYGAPLCSTIAVCLSLFCIMVTSVLVGTTLPFLFKYVGVCMEHAAPCIQVFMDITGVFLTCFLCSLILPLGEVNTIITRV